MFKDLPAVQGVDFADAKKCPECDQLMVTSVMFFTTEGNLIVAEAAGDLETNTQSPSERTSPS